MNLATGILLAAVGIGIIIFWVQHIIKGGLPGGVKTNESGGYIIFHITIELLTGVLCVIGGLTLILGLSWNMPVALFASGMLFYTGVNSLAWKEVRNRPVLSLMFIVPAVIAIFSSSYLIIAIID